jgi:hypothetical protein
MGVINSRNRYEFDPKGYAGDGGLPGMLQRALQEQSLQRQGNDPVRGISEHDPNSFAGLQGSQLGRLLAMQAEEAPYQPGFDGLRLVSLVPRDSNFRQLSRIPAGGTSPSDRSSESTNLVARVLGNSFPLPEGESSDDSFGTIAASGAAPPTVPVGWRARGAPIRTYPPASVFAPPIQDPKVPDWWITAAKIGQLLFRGMYGNAGDGKGAYGRCVSAAGGSVDDWENFCRFLGRGENNTVGGESQNRACWGKTFESENEKRQWCENQFGNR